MRLAHRIGGAVRDEAGTGNSNDEMRGFFPFALLWVRMTFSGCQRAGLVYL